MGRAKKRGNRKRSTKKPKIVVVVKQADRRDFMKTIATAVATTIAGEMTKQLWSGPATPGKRVLNAKPGTYTLNPEPVVIRLTIGKVTLTTPRRRWTCRGRRPRAPPSDG